MSANSCHIAQLCNTADKVYDRLSDPSMPDKPSYIQRLTAILAEAKRPKPIPFFRRGDMEVLFGLKRRQAINLMHAIGAVRVSNEIAVEQRDLVSWLEKRAADPARTRGTRPAGEGHRPDCRIKSGKRR